MVLDRCWRADFRLRFESPWPDLEHDAGSAFRELIDEMHPAALNTFGRAAGQKTIYGPNGATRVDFVVAPQTLREAPHECFVMQWAGRELH